MNDLLFYAKKWSGKVVHNTHTHTQIYIYIHIYIYIYWQHIFIDTYLIEHYRHFFVYIFLLIFFELPFRYYDIRWQSADKPSVIRDFSSIFCSTLGDYQGKIHYKNVVILYVHDYLIRMGIYTVVLRSVYFLKFFCTKSVSNKKHLSTLAWDP